MPQNSTQLYGVKAMEEEIVSTFTIEQVDFTRDSVRKDPLRPCSHRRKRKPYLGHEKGTGVYQRPSEPNH